MSYTPGITFSVNEAPTSSKMTSLGANDDALMAQISALITTLATGSNAGSASGDTNTLKVGSLRLTWGRTATVTNGTTGLAVTYPVAYSVRPKVLVGLTDVANDARQLTIANGESTTGFTAIVQNYGANATASSTVTWFAIGPA